MQPPKEQEWLVAEGIQGMLLTPVMVLTVGQQISSVKWEFSGYRFYPGAIQYMAPAYLYSSKIEALDDIEPVTTLKCWRETNPVDELIDDLIIALSTYQSKI